MQIVADGYVNVNVVVLLNLDMVTHLINFKYINVFQKIYIRKCFWDFSSTTKYFFLLVMLMGFVNFWHIL